MTGNNGKYSTCFIVVLISAVVLAFLPALSPCIDGPQAVFPAMEVAYADIQVGDDVTLKGWQPDEMVSSDIQVEADPQAMTSGLESAIIRFIKLAMPILMLACVVEIIYTAVRNIFVSRKKPEERVKMGDLIKNMFVQFFFILCSFLIVELIVFGVTNGESLLVTVLFGQG